jgi:hypothetical protein
VYSQLATGDSEGSKLSVQFYTSANAQISTTEIPTVAIASPFTHSADVAIPSNADHWFVEHYNTAVNPPTFTDTVSLTLTCPGGSGGSFVTPCVTDPATMALLEQILQYVTLIQRQAVPFAYVAGTVHSGLTGSGTIAVQGLIGAIVEITSTLGDTIGEAAGDPPFLYSAGWLNWGSVDGYIPRQFLEATTTLSLPPEAGAYTSLNYSLPPGVTVTITELSRES